MSLARLQSLDTRDPRWRDLLVEVIGRISAVGVTCQIFLFGSFTRGQLTAASDIDLAVIIESELKSKEFLDRLYAAGPLSPWPLDLLVLSRKDFERRMEIGGVCEDIMRDGTELYPNWRLNEPG